MILSEMAEAAVPIGVRNEDARVVFCAECGAQSDAGTLAGFGFICPCCGARICVMCGCTDDVPCVFGCAWVVPGRCTSHNEELRLLALKVFGG